MRYSWRSLIGFYVVLVLLLTALPVAATMANGKVEVVDQAGRTVDIPQPVERIVSVYGISTYYVYALGAGDRMVSAWYVQIKGLGQAPAALREIEPKLGEKLSFGQPNLEDIVAKDPDLVLTNPVKHGDLADRLTNLGIPAIQYAAETPETMKEAMLLTGKALGPDTTARAQEFADYYNRVMEAIGTATDAIPADKRLRVYFCGSNPLRAASGDMYQSLMIDTASGISVTRDIRGYWNDLNLEQVLVWQPDVIIITSYGGLTPAQILDDPDWQSVPAVRDGRVYKMPALAAAWDTPVPDSLLGIMWLAHVLYPHQIGFDLAAECRTFYSRFYGYVLSDEEVARLTGN